MCDQLAEQEVLPRLLPTLVFWQSRQLGLTVVESIWQSSVSGHCTTGENCRRTHTCEESRSQLLLGRVESVFHSGRQYRIRLHIHIPAYTTIPSENRSICHVYTADGGSSWLCASSVVLACEDSSLTTPTKL